MAKIKTDMSTKLVIIVLLGVAFVAGYLIAREKYKPQINELSAMVIDRDDKITYLNNLRNRLFITNGELMQNQDGAITTVEEALILSDGSRIEIDGTITRPNGDVEELKEGEYLFMDGEIITEEDLKVMDSSEE